MARGRCRISRSVIFSLNIRVNAVSLCKLRHKLFHENLYGNIRTQDFQLGMLSTRWLRKCWASTAAWTVSMSASGEPPQRTVENRYSYIGYSRYTSVSHYITKTCVMLLEVVHCQSRYQTICIMLHLSVNIFMLCQTLGPIFALSLGSLHLEAYIIHMIVHLYPARSTVLEFHLSIVTQFLRVTVCV